MIKEIPFHSIEVELIKKLHHQRRRAIFYRF